MRPLLRYTLTMLLALGVAAGRLHAQQPGTRADSAAVLLTLARSLAAEGHRNQAEVLFQILRQRYAGTPAADEAATEYEQLHRRQEGQSGRGELIAWTTLYGTWLGGAVPAALGAEDAEVYGAGLLVGGPAGFLTATSIANASDVSSGRAKAITFGWMWGTWQAVGWREALHLGDQTITTCYAVNQCYNYTQRSEGVEFRAAILGGVAGFATGALLSAGREISPGTMNAVQLSGLWGSWYGIVLASLADMQDDAAMTTVLLSGDAAVATALAVAPSMHFSASRPWVVSAAGFAGLVGGLGLDLLFQPNDDKTVILIPAATSAAGLAIGFGATADDVADGTSGAPGGAALLHLTDGRLAVGAPLPLPGAVKAADLSGRVRVTPAIKLNLLRLNF